MRRESSQYNIVGHAQIHKFKLLDQVMSQYVALTTQLQSSQHSRG